MEQLRRHEQTQQSQVAVVASIQMAPVQSSVSGSTDCRKADSPLTATHVVTPTRSSGTKRLSVEREQSLILIALHSGNREVFRDAIEALLTDDERDLIAAAESLSLPWQACGVFDGVVRRLSLRFAELVGWPPNAIADIVEPAKKLSDTMRCVVLNMPASRSLKGRTAFKLSEPQDITDRFPASAIHALANTRHYWAKVVYLEPIFHNGKVLRSQREVRRLRCRPADPIVAASLGSGPLNYGYSLYNPWEQSRRRGERRPKMVKRLAFLVAHWD